MQAVIVHPLTVEKAVRARSATRHMGVAEARRAILPSRTMEPLERLKPGLAGFGAWIR